MIPSSGPRTNGARQQPRTRAPYEAHRYVDERAFTQSSVGRELLPISRRWSKFHP